MPSEYVYQTAAGLRQPSPYSYAPVEDGSFLARWLRARRALEARLRASVSAAASTAAHIPNAWRATLQPLTSNQARPAADGPEPALEHDLARARAAWDGALAADGSAVTVTLLQDILTACLPRGRSLAGGGAHVIWTVTMVERLLRRFEVRRRVFDRYDAQLRRVGDRSDAPAVYAWLALAAGWRGHSCVQHDRPAALVAANALLQLVDLIGARVEAGLWELAPLDALAGQAGLVLERTLIDAVAAWPREENV